LVLVYVVVLILNLLFCNDSFISFHLVNPSAENALNAHLPHSSQ
jgi:hypothetical protein